MRPPFMLFDPESAMASGDPDAGFFDGRSLYGDDHAAESGQIATLEQAIELRAEMAERYNCKIEDLQIVDSYGCSVPA
jgi:hypothetical protein